MFKVGDRIRYNDSKDAILYNKTGIISRRIEYNSPRWAPFFSIVWDGGFSEDCIVGYSHRKLVKANQSPKWRM